MVLVGDGGVLCVDVVMIVFLEVGDFVCFWVGEDVWLVDDVCVFGVFYGDFDDVDIEECCIIVFFWIFVGVVFEFVVWVYRVCVWVVDVEGVGVVWVGDDCVGVWVVVCLDGCDLLWYC